MQSVGCLIKAAAIHHLRAKTHIFNHLDTIGNAGLIIYDLIIVIERAGLDSSFSHCDRFK